jgi:hypothetical protein
MMGRWIRGSGWYPNFRQPQFFRKGSMRHTLEPVHESYEILNGKPVGTLTNAIWQFPFRNLEEVIKKMNRYTKRRKAGRRRKANRSSGRTRLSAVWARGCARPWTWSNAPAPDR